MRRFLILAALAAAALAGGGCVVYPGGYGYYGYNHGWYGPAPVVRGPIVYRNPYYHHVGHHHGW